MRWSLSSNGSHLLRPTPYFVHRDLNVVLDGGAIELVRTCIGGDRAEEFDPLLICYFLGGLWPWSRLSDDKNDHAAVFAVGDITARACSWDNLFGINDGSLLTDEGVDPQDRHVRCNSGRRQRDCRSKGGQDERVRRTFPPRSRSLKISPASQAITDQGLCRFWVKS